MRMVEWLQLIEEAIKHAEAGKPVVLFDWISMLHKDRVACHALLRVLFLVMTIENVTAEDVARLRLQLKSTTEQRQRPVRHPRQPGERLSPKLW